VQTAVCAGRAGSRRAAGAAGVIWSGITDVCEYSSDLRQISRKRPVFPSPVSRRAQSPSAAASKQFHLSGRESPSIFETAAFHTAVSICRHYRSLATGGQAVTGRAGAGAAKKCAKCGSEDIIPDVPIEADGTNVYIKIKRGGVFAGSAKSPLKCSVCGTCGFIELYAESPAALLETYRQRKVRLGY
jgi:hypothetical protein